MALRRPFARYVLFQIPGWVLTAGLVYAFWPRTGLEPWLGGLAVLAWVVKDFLMWPLVRVGYQVDVRHGAAELVGENAVVQRPLTPRGSVRIRGELWSACEDGERSGGIAEGATVEVVGVQGMTLVVRRRAETPQPGSAEGLRVSDRRGRPTPSSSRTA